MLLTKERMICQECVDELRGTVVYQPMADYLRIEIDARLAGVCRRSMRDFVDLRSAKPLYRKDSWY